MSVLGYGSCCDDTYFTVQCLSIRVLAISPLLGYCGAVIAIWKLAMPERIRRSDGIEAHAAAISVDLTDWVSLSRRR